jgi:hypothetical protein
LEALVVRPYPVENDSSIQAITNRPPPFGRMLRSLYDVRTSSFPSNPSLQRLCRLLKSTTGRKCPLVGDPALSS